jgi:transposase InsO family protein
METPPAVTTIWRILTRAGLITPEPRKRPRRTYLRFEADLPNETWQSDFTNWRLANGHDAEILLWLEDLDNLRQAHFDYTIAVNNGSAAEARDRERASFDAVNSVNGGQGNAYTDLINNNLPGYTIGDGQATPERWR